MAQWIRGNKLPTFLQQQILDMYVHRMTNESIARWPATANYMNKHGYSIPPKSDAEWLAKYEFSVTKSGQLDQRTRYARPYYGN